MITPVTLNPNFEMVYLAGSYSNPDVRVMEERVELATRTAAILSGMGYFVFSPLTHNHPILSDMGPVPLRNVDHWLTFDVHILALCKKLIIIDHPSHRVSKGIKLEVRMANEWRIPILMAEVKSAIPPGIGEVRLYEPDYVIKAETFQNNPMLLTNKTFVTYKSGKTETWNTQDVIFQNKLFFMLPPDQEAEMEVEVETKNGTPKEAKVLEPEG